MTLEILYNLNLIFQDFFSAFGIFTILFFITSIFIKKQALHKIDDESVKFISFIGILYLSIWIIGNIVELNIINQEDKVALLNRMLGKYWFGFWIQPLIWSIITQLLRFKKISRNILLRLLFSLLLIVSIERMIIIYTSFHRDYLPSSWTMYNDFYFYPSNLVIALILKIIVFLFFVFIYRLIRLKITEWKSKTK